MNGVMCEIFYWQYELIHCSHQAKSSKYNYLFRLLQKRDYARASASIDAQNHNWVEIRRKKFTLLHSRIDNFKFLLLLHENSVFTFNNRTRIGRLGMKPITERKTEASSDPVLQASTRLPHIKRQAGHTSREASRQQPLAATRSWPASPCASYFFCAQAHVQAKPVFCVMGLGCPYKLNGPIVLVESVAAVNYLICLVPHRPAMPKQIRCSAI